MTPYERIGGEPVVRGIIDRFVDRMFADLIIGFRFANADPVRVKQHEFEHAAQALGATLPYTGRPIAGLHRPMRINAGQFRRRLALLRQELERANLPPEVEAEWMKEQRRMEHAITDGTDCVLGVDDAEAR